MPRIDASTKLYGLVGMGISYTLSPAIHNYIFELSGVNAVYLAFDIADDRFDTAFKGLQEVAEGLNVTIPYKERALQHIKRLSPLIERIGCINTVHKGEGYNTDYLAVKQLVSERAGSVDGMKCLVVGAGGAAKASSYALAELGCTIHIMNRTRSRAEELASRLRGYGYDARAIAECEPGYDVLLNATPDPSHIPSKCVGSFLVVDLVYRPVKTPLIRAALERGARVINGLEVLIRQAILAQSIWQGRNLLGVEGEVRDYICRATPSVEC